MDFPFYRRFSQSRFAFISATGDTVPHIYTKHILDRKQFSKLIRIIFQNTNIFCQPKEVYFHSAGKYSQLHSRAITKLHLANQEPGETRLSAI